MNPTPSSRQALYWLLWRLPVLQSRNRLRRFEMDEAFKNIILLSFTLLVGWAEFVFFNRFFTLLTQMPFGLTLVLPHLFSYMGSFLFAFLAYSGVLTALSALYRSTDLHLLITMPVRLGPILLAKWVDVAVRSGITLVLLMIPPMLAMGLRMNLGAEFYFIYFLSLLSIAACAVSLGYAAALILMLFFPARRMHQTAALLGLLLATGVVMAIRFLHLENLWSESAQQSPLLLFLQQKPRGLWSLGPGELFAHAVSGSLAGRPDRWKWLGGGLLAGGGSIPVCLAIGRLVFLRGWWKSQEQGDPTVLNRRFVSRRFWNRLPLPRIMRAMLWKDWLILIRDPSVWTQLFMMIPLAALYLLNISFLPKQEPAIQPLLAVTNVGLIGLIVAAVGARFLFPAASREGRAIWIPLVAPMRPVLFLIQKSVFVLPPVLGLSFGLLLISNWILAVSWDLFVWCIAYGMVLVSLMALQAVCLGIWLPSFRYHHLLEVSLGKGAFLFMVLALLETGSLVYLSLRHIFQGETVALHVADGSLLFWLLGWSAVTGLIGLGSLRRVAHPEIPNV